MNNTTKPGTADHAATTAQLLTLVSELRGLRDRAMRDSGRTVTFVEIAHASVAGCANTTPKFHQFLMDVAGILDANTPQAVDGELAKEWRTAVRAWLERQL
jgi:hypothetical protein